MPKIFLITTAVAAIAAAGALLVFVRRREIGAASIRKIKAILQGEIPPESPVNQPHKPLVPKKPE